VAVTRGVTTLTGHVESYAEKWATERAAERVSASNAPRQQDSTVTTLAAIGFSRDESKELSMITIEYPPGRSTPVHTHRAQALVYVVEGLIVMQVRGGPSVTLSTGQTWYEGPDDVHVGSRNASSSAAAKYVVFMVKDKGVPILTPVE
jgi:quercetin dioxygenase-like cupin family protein